MSCLKHALAPVFNHFSGFAIIGPHNGYERILLEAGAKPVGLFDLCKEEELPDVPPLFREFYKQTLNDCRILDRLVEKGILIKKIATEWDGQKTIVYAQQYERTKLEEMIKLIETRRPGPKYYNDEYYKKMGTLLGYTLQDQDYFLHRSKKIDTYKTEFQRAWFRVSQSITRPWFNFLRYCRKEALLAKSPISIP